MENPRRARICDVSNSYANGTIGGSFKALSICAGFSGRSPVKHADTGARASAAAANAPKGRQIRRKSGKKLAAPKREPPNIGRLLEVG